MVWSRGRAAAALAAGALSTLASAQGFFGGDQSTCGAEDAFVDIGCFTGPPPDGLTPFRPTTYDPATFASFSYPGFDPGSIINNTVTPQSCIRVCRGYGYRTASLNAGDCACGYGLPASFPPLIPGTCDTPCPGDSAQFCGGDSATRLFVDPSFADPGLLNGATAEQIADYYQYLGCFHQEGAFPTDDGANTHSIQASVDLCLQRCAELRYPLARATPATAGQVTCDCGETFDFGDYRVREGEETPVGSCAVDCASGTIDGCDPEDPSQTCCGSSNYFPVYINPELEGCYVPSIPGYGLLNENNQPTGFVCADVPATLTSGPTAYPANPAAYTAGTPVEPTAQPIHPVQVNAASGTQFFEFGCFAQTAGGLFAGGDEQQLLSYTLETCAEACANRNFFGIRAGETCYCADSTDTEDNVAVDFGQCNVRCANNARQLCGGENAFEVYAVAGQWTNDVAQSIQAAIATPYPATECNAPEPDPTNTDSSSTTSETSTQTNSETTTETGTTTETSTDTSATSTDESTSATDEPTTTRDNTTGATGEPTTTDGTSSTSTDATTTTSQSLEPTIPPSTNSYIFGISVLLTEVRKRQDVVVGPVDGGFVGGAGPVNPSNCTDATPFIFADGTLSSGGQLISTEPGLDYQPFFTDATNGSITGTFMLEGNVLVWNNDAFENGQATFCKDTQSGQVYIRFNSNPVPFDCTPIQLVAFQAQACDNGEIIVPTTTPSVPTSTPIPTGTDTATETTTGDATNTGGSGTSVPTGTGSNTEGTATATGTGSKTSTSQSSVPTAPSSADSFIFAVAPVTIPINNTLARRSKHSRDMNKRQLQVGAGFVGAAGPVNPTDCTLATPFNFTAGTLSSGGELVSTDPGIAYQPFWTNPEVGAITTNFAVQDGILVWQNAAFANFDADFCQDGSGQVWVIFDANPTPFECTPVYLVPFATSDCDDGTLITTGLPTVIPTATPVPTGTGLPTTTASPTLCTSGACLGNGTLTLGPGTFFNDAVAATARPIADCTVRNETWVFGETTLLPRSA